MDKNIIKKHLNLTFLSEETVPGISVTASAKKESGKFNKDGVKAIEKDVAAFEKNIKADKDAKGMAQNKFNYDDDFEKTYHDEMEIMNGQEMLQYDSKPNDTFKKRAEEGMSGSAQMGNEGGIGNAEAAWGASSDDFGKNLVKRVKDSSKKRDEETPTLRLRGQNIQADMKDTGNRPYALSENNKDNNKPQIKEGMKRLKFKKEFNGVGNALNMIPESYRVDNKQFEMTDGNETYKIRWEGNLTEGRAVVLMASDKRMVNEDMAHMKHLMGYKSQETLGTVKGKARLTENAVFGDIFNKSKALLEGTDIESAKAKTGNLEDIKKKAPEASKHIQGSVSKDKGTQAPSAKEGDLDDAVSHAAEAKKHVEGSVSTEKGTKAPAPKKGEWEAVKKKSADATKHVTMKESFQAEEEGEMNEISTGLANKAGISSRFPTGDEIGDEKRNRQSDRFTRYVNPEIKSAIERIGGEIESTDYESITFNIQNVQLKVTSQGYEILSGELKYLPSTTINALKPLMKKISSDLQMFKEGKVNKFTENVYESFQAEEEEEEEGVEDVATKEVKTEGENIEGKKTKSGHWDEISVPHAAEAKKHIHMGKESKSNLETEAKEEPITESVTINGITFEPINESWMEEGMDENFFKNLIGKSKPTTNGETKTSTEAPIANELKNLTDDQAKALYDKYMAMAYSDETRNRSHAEGDFGVYYQSMANTLEKMYPNAFK